MSLPAFASAQQSDTDDEYLEPSYAVPTRMDRVGRIVVPARVNRQGPFQFVLDTGANTTIITPHLAQTLGLTVDMKRMINLQGITSAALVPTTIIERIESGAVILQGKRLAVANASLVGTDGILGVDGLARKLVLVDFLHDTVEVLDAARQRPSDRLMRIPARIRSKRLVAVDALVSGLKAEAVIDTGGQRTLGNLALYDALGLKPAPAAANAMTDVIGATNARQQGERRIINEIKMGNLRTTHLEVTFGDFYIFKAWDLQTKPALVIGMDLIGTLDTFGVDYLRHEVQIRIRR